MDTKTRHALKNDKFAQATADSMSWLSGHRSGVLRWVIIGVVVVVAAVGSLVVWNQRSAAAEVALNTAMDAYNAPLVGPSAPVTQGTYATASDRSKAANQQFTAIAQQYGWLSEGARAHYFAGVTYEELGQNGPAETELKAAAGSWDRNLSNLAKLALAGLYHQTDRDAQAIDIYTALANKPSETVPATVARLDLADLYAATGKQEQAKALWVKVKADDKDGAAGGIAAQKLGAKE